MRRILLFFALASMGLASCNSGYKTGENGLLYVMYTNKPGPKIKIGDFVNANIIVKNDADSIISNTYEQGGAKPMVVQSTTKGDIFSALSYLAEGDSALIKISTDSIFKSRQRPPFFKGKYVNYIVKIERVIPKGSMTNGEFTNTINLFLMTQTYAQRTAEPKKIKKYIDDNKLNLTKTDSGLYYMITKKGTGPLAAKGDLVFVNYTGRLLNGKVFDTNVEEEAKKAKLTISAFKPIAVPLGKNKTMAGWEQGLLLLNKGAKATFIIPSVLAYGEQGNDMIGPFTPLVFDIEVVKILYPKSQGTHPEKAMPPQ